MWVCWFVYLISCSAHFDSFFSVILTGFSEYWSVTFVVFAYTFHLREDGTRACCRCDEKENRPLKCSEKGLLYYADTNVSINKKEAQKLWEYLHENRENLYIFKSSFDMEKKSSYLDNIESFKQHIQKNFAHKKIVKLKKDNKFLEISIFPNGNLYDMSGEPLNEVDRVWEVLYELGGDGRFGD